MKCASVGECLRGRVDASMGNTSVGSASVGKCMSRVPLWACGVHWVCLRGQRLRGRGRLRGRRPPWAYASDCKSEPPWAAHPCAQNALPEEDGRIRKGAYAIRWHKPHLAVSNTRPLPCMRESIKTSPWTMASVGQGLYGPSSSLVTCRLVTAYLVRSRRPRTGAVIRHVAFRLLEVVQSARARRRRQSTSTFSG